MFKNVELKFIKQVLRLIPVNFFLKDKNGYCLGCNYQQLQGLQLKTLEEYIGKTDKELYSEKIAACIMQNDREVMENRQEKTFEEVGVNAFGEEAIYLSKKSPLYDEFGQVVGLVGVGIDITERKKTEEYLKIAKETEFLQNVCHDIRTPLAGIVSCARLIQEQLDNSKKATEYIDKLVQSGDTLLVFLNNILENIAVSGDNIALLKKRFSLKEILEKIIYLNRSQATVKKLVLNLNYDEGIPSHLIGDPIRVQRIFLELLSNALKFTDKGQIKISARLIKNKKREVIIELRVSDTGIGIPRDKHNDIYTRFKRSQGVYPEVELGLSMVKKFIDDLSGEIYIESEPQQGTTFICVIPFQKSLLMDKSDGEESDITPDESIEKKYDCLSTRMNTGYAKPLTFEKATKALNTFIPHQQRFQITHSTLQDFVLIDIDKAMEFMGDKEFTKEIFQLFADNLTTDIAVLKRHYQARDWRAIQAIAYKWRVEASYCGANRLGKVCQPLETLLQRRLFKEAEMNYQLLLEAARGTKRQQKMRSLR